MNKMLRLFLLVVMTSSLTIACSPKEGSQTQVDKEIEDQIDKEDYQAKDENIAEEEKEEVEKKEEENKKEENKTENKKPEEVPEKKPEKKPVIKPTKPSVDKNTGSTNTQTPPKGENIDKKQVDIKDIHQKIKREYGGDYIPNTPMQVENLTGIKKEDTKAIIAETPMITVNVDTFIAVHAKEGKASAIEQRLQAYRKSLVEQSTMYPMNQAKVNASKVVRHGDYVFFLMQGKQILRTVSKVPVSRTYDWRLWRKI